MGVAGPIFEQHPSNLVRIYTFLSCKNAENFVTKSQMVLELGKISVSLLSISRGVLAQTQHFLRETSGRTKLLLSMALFSRVLRFWEKNGNGNILWIATPT